VLNAFAILVVIDEGKFVHEQIVQSGWDLDVFVGNCLVNIYAKCGSMQDT